MFRKWAHPVLLLCMAYALRSPADAACWLVTLTWLLIGAILSPEPRCVRLTPPPAGPAFWLVPFSHLSLDACGWLRPQLVLHSDWSYSLTWASMRAADSAPSWSLSSCTWAMATCVCCCCWSSCCRSNCIWWWALSGSCALCWYVSPSMTGEDMGELIVPPPTPPPPSCKTQTRRQASDYKEYLFCFFTWFLLLQTYMLYPFNIVLFFFFSRQCEMLSDN